MTVPLSRQLARAVRARRLDDLPPAVGGKLKVCLLDFLACALTARELPWSREAAEVAARSSGPATIVGTALTAPVGDAAFANGVAGHGLVQEDMHAGAVSHLGVVVLPALLALAQREKVSGRAFAAAAVAGYEVGARLGRLLVTRDFARRFRPTGFTGPLAAALAGASMLGLSEEACASALALAANTVSGLNQWPHEGGAEMFFHPGFAARNAIMAVELAELGAAASSRILEGPGGFFAAYLAGQAVPSIALFSGEPELLAVYNKPVPACNFAQTPCQAALDLVAGESFDAADIQGIEVAASQAAVAYPGCDYSGPFERRLQAKMSIQFGVAAAFRYGRIDEDSYRSLDDPALLRLAARTRLRADAGYTAAFPALQGASVAVALKDGRHLQRQLDDVRPASPDAVRRRFRAVAAQVLGQQRATAVEERVDALETLESVGDLMRLASLPADAARAARLSAG